MLSILLLLIIPSALLYGLLVFHAVRNRGARAAALYFGSAALYGVVRATLLRGLTDGGEDVLLPYLMTFPVLRIGVASLPEVLGWGLAVSVAWLAADRLLRRAGLAPSPHRTAAVAALGLACISFAVETAAIGAGWWTWTIKQPLRPLLGRVPPVGLLDWGFVAFDFLLPYLLLATPASWVRRLTSLAIFPLHFLAHPRVMPLLESFPLSIDDLAHGAILAYVLASAVGEGAPAPALPDPQAEKHRWLPPVAAMVIALATALASIILGDPWSALASLPLFFLAVVAFLLPARFGRQPSAETSLPRGSRRRGAARSQPRALPRLAVVLLVLAAVYVLRAPFHRHTQLFVASFEEGVGFLNAGDLDGAEREFRRGLDARPDQASGRAILAHVLLRQGRTAEARRELEAALDLNPTQPDALVLLATLDLQEGRFEEAARHAGDGRRFYPHRAEFAYQAVKAAAGREGGRGAPPDVSAALDLARRGGPKMARSLAFVAAALGDDRTVAACRPLTGAGPGR